jgi:tetratricopeptide (TPR) repeat protein
MNQSLEIGASRNIVKYPPVIWHFIVGAGIGVFALLLILTWTGLLKRLSGNGETTILMAGAVAGGLFFSIRYIGKVRRIETQSKISLDRDSMTYQKYNGRATTMRWEEIESIVETWQTADETTSGTASLTFKNRTQKIIVDMDDFDDGYILLRAIVKRRLPQETKLVGYTYRSGLEAKELLKIARLFRSWDHLEEATEAYQKAIEAAEYYHNKNHPLVAECLGEIAGILRKMGKGPEADKMEARAQDIRKAPQEDESLQKSIWRELKKKKRFI